jgi:hypothetical protein
MNFSTNKVVLLHKKSYKLVELLMNARKALQTPKWDFLYYIPYHINICLKSNLTQCVSYIKIWETMHFQLA